MRRLLFAIELYINGFRNCWQLAKKLIQALEQTELKDLGSFKKYLD